jgi:hypothetical protein
MAPSGSNAPGNNAERRHGHGRGNHDHNANANDGNNTDEMTSNTSGTGSGLSGSVTFSGTDLSDNNISDNISAGTDDIAGDIENIMVLYNSGYSRDDPKWRMANAKIILMVLTIVIWISQGAYFPMHFP